MATDIKAPQFPESVADGTVATWHKKEGEAVKRDELLVDIETDKVVLEVVAPSDGVVAKILKDEGDTVESQEVLGQLEAGSGAGGADSGASKDEDKDTANRKKRPRRTIKTRRTTTSRAVTKTPRPARRRAR